MIKSGYRQSALIGDLYLEEMLEKHRRAETSTERALIMRKIKEYQGIAAPRAPRRLGVR